MFYTTDVVGILNIVLLCLFIATFVALGLFFLRGWFRGWIYGTYRVLAFAIVIIVCCATLGVVANAVGSLDLSSWGLPQIPDPLSTDQNPVYIKFGSLFSVIETYVTDYMISMKVNMSGAELANYAAAIASSIVKLVVLIIEGILTATIVNVLIMILWHVGWVHFIPKEKRKESYHKKRWISGLEDVLIGFVCGAMIIFPLTSIVNSFSSGFNKASEKDEPTLRANNETYAQVSDVVNAYDNSLFAKVFFAWTKNSSGQTYDASLTSWLTTGNYDQAQVSVINELQSFTKIGSIALEGGLLSKDGMNGQTITLFLLSDYAPELLRAVASSGLISKLMPFALTIVSSLDGVKNYLKVNDESFYSTFDYPATFNKLADLYQAVVDSSFADNIVDENGKLKDTPSIIEAAFTGTAVTPLQSLLNGLDSNDLKLVDTLLSAAAYCTACNETANPPTNGIGIKSFMPKFVTYDADGDGTPDAIPQAYKDIQWGHQLALVYDGLMSLSKLDSNFLSTVLSGFSSSGYKLSDAASKQLLTTTLNHIDEVGPIFYGGTDSQGFLDSCFLSYGFPTVLSLLQDTLNTSFSLSGNAAIDLTSVSKALCQDSAGNDLALADTANNIKGEAKNLFQVLTTLVDYQDGAGKKPGQSFLQNIDAMPGLYFSPKDGTTLVGADDGLLTALSESLALIDRSKIATAVMPDLFDHFLSTSNPFQSMGVDFKFDFHCANLGGELSKMVQVYRDSQDLIAFSSSLSGAKLEGDALSNAFKGLASYSDQLSTLLTGLAGSAILNPVIYDSSNNAINNSNITSLLNALLKSSFGDYSTQITSLLSAMSVSETKAEMTSIVGFVVAASKSGLFESLSSFKNDPTNLGLLTKVDFKTLLSKVGESKLFSNLFGDILDKETFQNASAKSYIGTSLTDNGSISFKNITDWAAEGEAIQALIKAASEIGDLKNIDYLHSDPVAVSNIIKALSGSGIFSKTENGTTTYLFPQYMAEKLVTSIKDNASASAYFTDKGTTDQFTVLKSSFESLKTPASWAQEADALGEVIASSERLGGFEVISATGDLRQVNVTEVKVLLNAISSSTAFGQILSFHIYEKINSSLVDAGLSAFQDSNVSYVYSADASSRGYENEQLTKLLSAVLNPNGKDSNGKLTYALLDNTTGKIDSSKLKSIDDIDASFTLRPILSAMASSHVFNTLKVNDNGTYGLLTAFEKEIVSVMSDYGAYSSNALASAVISQIAPDNVNYSLTQELNRFDRWNEEIVSLCQVVNDIQELHLDFTNFSLSSLFPSTNPALAEANQPKLAALLDDIAASKLLYPALPSKLATAIDNLNTSLKGSGSNSISLEGANVYYQGSTALSGGELLVSAPYGKDENESLSLIVMNASLLGDNVSFSNLSSTQVAAAGDMLNSLAKSHVFNSTSDGSSETCFQKILVQALTSDGIKDVYYSAANPKDALESYSDASSKAVSVATTSFPQIAKDADESKVTFSSLNGDTNSLKSILNLIATNPGLKNALTAGQISSLTDTQISSLLSELNGCDLTRDCVPNALSKFLNDPNISISNIDLSRANPYYCYYLDSSNEVDLSLTPDFSKKYSADEIGFLSNIFSALKDNDLRNAFSSATSSLDDAKIGKMKAILLNLSSSYVFEKGHAWHWDSSAKKALTSVTTPNSLGTPDNLSVFEQLMFSFYDQTGLALRSFDPAYDYKLYKAALDSGLTGDPAKTAASKAKLYAALVVFDNDSFASTPTGTTLHSGNWAAEIGDLTEDGAGGGLLHTMIHNDDTKDYFTSSTSFSSGNLSNFKNLSPATIGVVMRCLNKLDLAHDAVPYSIASLVEDSCLFRNYSILEKTVSSIGSANYSIDSLFPNPVGRYDFLSVTMTSETEPSVTAYDSNVSGHDSFTVPVLNHTAGSFVYTFDLGTLYPYYFAITSTGLIDSITFKYNTSNYILTQAEFNGNASSTKTPLDVIEDFAKAMYVGNSYVNFSDSANVQSFLLKEGTVGATLAYLREENGFYTRRGYQADYTAATSLSSAAFLSRDVTFRSMLRFSFDSSGVTGNVDLAQYFARDRSGTVGLYQAIKAALTDASFVNADEGQWIQDNLLALAQSDLLYSQAESATYSFTYLGVSYNLDVSNATKYAEMMAADTSDTILNLLKKGATSFTSKATSTSVTSRLGKSLASGLGDRLLSAQANYLTMDGTNSGLYLKLPSLLIAPDTYGTSRTTLLPSSWSYPSFFDQNFALLSTANSGGIKVLEDLTALERYLRISSYLSSGNASLASADKNAVDGLLRQLDAFVSVAEDNVVQVAELYYLANIYGCLLNRGYLSSGSGDRFYYVDSTNTFEKAGAVIAYA